MELTVSVLNVRFGEMEQEDKSKMLWSKITILEEDVVSRDGFGGIQAAEIRLCTENNNALAKEIHSNLISGLHSFPVQMKLKTKTQVKKGEVMLQGVGFQILGQK